MRVMRLIIESIDLFTHWMINHDKSLESLNFDSVKKSGNDLENGWYYLEQFMSSWWVKIKAELLVIF